MPPTTVKTRGNWLRFSLRTLFILVTLAGIGTWGKLQYDRYRQRQLAAMWVQPLVELPAAPRHVNPRGLGIIPFQNLPSCPADLKSAEQLRLLVIGATELGDPRQRMAALKILVESRGGAQSALLEILAKSNDSAIQVAAIRLLALQREPSLVDRVMPYLSHEQPVVRAAAAESLGFIYAPSFEIPSGNTSNWDRPAFLDTRPPIRVDKLRATPTLWSERRDGPPGLRRQIEQMMLAGATDEERIAAARALVAWPPPNYSLRIAEWGVWIDDGGHLKLVQSVLDEIPPFVHRTGNPVHEFSDRINPIMMITKPIVHVTTDVPMAIDLQVVIRRGRPWFAYPMPDDLPLEASTVYLSSRLVSEGGKVSSPLLPLERPDFGSLRLQEGYPWIAPAHRNVGGMSGGMGAEDNVITDIGVRWQSLVVSPQHRPWMLLPAVSDDARFSWWLRLREVPGCWLASRGQSERFLYYDGPTMGHSPADICGGHKRLYVLTQDMFPRWDHIIGQDYGDPRPLSRKMLLVQVKGDNKQGLECDIPGESQKSVVIELTDPLPLSGAEVETRFTELLLDAGLRPAEAGGLMKCWRSQLFATDGMRALVLLSRQDYDRMCPLTVRPTPTEIARVGIVLTELDTAR